MVLASTTLMASALPKTCLVEVGGNFNFGFGSEKGEKVEYAGNWIQSKQKMTNINLRVPVNFVYRFNVSDDFKIAPYVGINFKLNLVSKCKDVVDSNLSKDELKKFGYEEPDWVNLYSDSKENMGDSDRTWNRFQMGWQIGVGFEYQKYYLGVQYGTDFIPAYSHKFESSKPKVNSQALKISLGYTF